MRAGCFDNALRSTRGGGPLFTEVLQNYFTSNNSFYCGCLSVYTRKETQYEGSTNVALTKQTTYLKDFFILFSSQNSIHHYQL